MKTRLTMRAALALGLAPVRPGPATGDGLLRAARAWVACHAEIAALRDRPEPPEVAQVRAAGRIGPRPASRSSLE